MNKIKKYAYFCIKNLISLPMSPLGYLLTIVGALFISFVAPEESLGFLFFCYIGLLAVGVIWVRQIDHDNR